MHTAQADANLSVTSVIAAPDVPRADVLAVAHQLAVAHSRHGRGSPVSLFDLPLGDGPLWTITEHRADSGGQHVEAVLPAWHVESKYDLLTVPDLAFGAAGDALKRRARIGGFVKAAQSAVAKYTQHGFEAAAVTALGVALGGRMSPPPGPYRTATVRFAHPYAVVATTHGPDNYVWSGLPVFAAWVTQPDDSS